MKATPEEGQAFSDAIDLVNNGIETIINLYNDLEPNHAFIQFEDDVMELIGKVKEKYGEAFVDKKVNAVVREMLEWLPLNEEKQSPLIEEISDTPAANTTTRSKKSEKKAEAAVDATTLPEK